MDSLTGQRIRQKRQSLQMTQKEMAEKAGIGQADVSRYERGAGISTFSLCCIADALCTSLDWLCGRENFVMLRTVETPKHGRLMKEEDHAE